MGVGVFLWVPADKSDSVSLGAKHIMGGPSTDLPLKEMPLALTLFFTWLEVFINIVHSESLRGSFVLQRCRNNDGFGLKNQPRFLDLVVVLFFALDW